METERWKLVDEILQSALELAPEHREEFLQGACGGDLTLADEIRSLLTSHRRAAGFLQSPALEIAAREIATDEDPLLAGSRVGQIVSPYRLLRIIGRGGMGSVWLAERIDGRFERRVAIKFIHLGILDEISAERFKREGAILGKLAHSQIAQLIDAGLTSAGEPYLVLEYVEGLAIDEYFDKNKLSMDERIRLFLSVLSAVAHAHSNLIVHRDIKPSNILVGGDAQVKLLDFGIAKVLESEANLDPASEITLGAGAVLTPRFAAPEQVSGGTITTATDIYALGVLLYLLLTGQHPAGRGPHTTAQLIKMIVEQEPPRPSDAVRSIGWDEAARRTTTPERLRRQLRGDLDTIVGKAIKKAPSERYASVLAFADDLRRYLEHKPVLARPDSLRYRTRKFMRRYRVTVAVAAIVVLITIAGVANFVIQDRKARAQRDFATRQLVRMQQHDEFLDFLLSDAAPSGKPFTVNNLLRRAQHILEKQKPSTSQIDLFEWVGGDYASQDQDALARPMLERAYQLSRQVSDPSLRASGSCSLGGALSRDEDLVRAEALIQEGLSELPNDPQYALARFDCLDAGSEVARQMGKTSEGLRRMELAQQTLRASPFDSDEYEMGTSLDLASMYSEAGRDQEALSEFQRAATIMSSLGRDETETAVVLYSNWALELDQVGRPLEAEKIYRRAIDISRDGSTEEAVSPMMQINFARVQRQLDHLARASDYAERAYEKAVKSGDELVVNQSLLERSRIYLAQHDSTRAKSMLAQVEPRLSKMLPPGHYAFAAISSERGEIAMENGDLPSALRLTDEAITTIMAAIKAGREGGSSLPDLYIDRSAIDLASGHAGQAETDAGLAIAALHMDDRSQEVSCTLGRAYLAQARALAVEGKSSQARSIASLALFQLRGSLGPDHPDSRTAQQLAQ